MKISNETRVGILAAIGIALLFIGYNFLKGINVFSKGDAYYVEYQYIPGLKMGDPVQVNGFQVGRVKDIHLKEDKSGLVVVDLSITEKIEIADDSKAEIRSADLLGEKYIQLFIGQSTVNIKPGGKIEGSIETDLTNQIRDELKPITEKVKSMVVSMDTAINVLSSLFTDQVKNDFEKSVSSIKTTLESFSNSAARLDKLLQNEEGNINSILADVSDITKNVNDNKSNINEVIQNLKNVSDSLSAVDWATLVNSFSTASKDLNEILTQIKSGDGSLGKLVYDKDLYDNLEKTSATLSSILTELQANPRSFIPPLIQIGGKKNNTQKDPN